MSGFKLDTRRLESALAFVTMASGRDLAVSLNKAGLTAIIGSSYGPGAMKLTPKASSAAIASVPDSKIASAVAANLRKSSKRVSSVEFKQLVRKEKARRRRASGYTAFAGWNNAAKALGGRGVRTNAEFPNSHAADGTGGKATSTNLAAFIVNTAPAAEKIGKAALQQGLNNAAVDLVVYGTKKLQQTFDKVNAR